MNNKIEIELDDEISGSLTKKQEDILDFIKKNQGVSKEDVIKNFKEKYSRIPIYNTIDELNKLNLIRITKNPNNRQTNSLSINNDNLLVKLIEDVDLIKTLYLGLIYKLENFLDENKNDELSYIIDIHDVFEFLISLYKFFMDMYFILLFLDFPQQTSDKYILNKSYFLFFSEIYPIMFQMSSLHVKRFLKVTSTFETYRSIGTPYSGVIDLIISNNILDEFRYNGYRIQDLLDKSTKLGIYNGIEILLDFLFDLYNKITKGEQIIKWRDYL